MRFNLALTVWAAKCVADLCLMGVCLNRRIRFAWLLGAYSFFTTLALMLVVRDAPGMYPWFRSLVGVGGAVVMSLVFMGLLSVLMKRNWLYLPMTIAYIGLLLTQMICVAMRWHQATEFIAWLEMLSWLIAVATMAMCARLIPRQSTALAAYVAHDLIIGD